MAVIEDKPLTLQEQELLTDTINNGQNDLPFMKLTPIGVTADNIADGFRISGLGQLIEAGITADRLVAFGD